MSSKTIAEHDNRYGKQLWLAAPIEGSNLLVRPYVCRKCARHQVAHLEPEQVVPTHCVRCRG